ncbi:hypothetical protein AAKU61_004596, partial [Undibacterium sp. GrIS 1.2]
AVPPPVNAMVPPLSIASAAKPCRLSDTVFL